MAVSIHLSSDDLAETRFAFSPIWELGMSLYKPMRDPSKHALHLPWVQEAKAAIEGRDLGILFAMVPPPGLPPTLHPYIPDFLTPAPETPFPQFEDELETGGPHRARPHQRRALPHDRVARRGTGRRDDAGDPRGPRAVRGQAGGADARVLEADDRAALAPHPGPARGRRDVPRPPARARRRRAALRRPASVAVMGGRCARDRQADV